MSKPGEWSKSRSMIFDFSQTAKDQLDFWKRSDPAKVKRIKAIMQAIVADPFDGIGKPEQLRHDLAGWWSRRIDHEHRFVYRIEGDRCVVLSCRFHYAK